MQFIATMRRLSGGKPAGFKLCIGHPWEFLAICKAMLETEHLSRLHRRRRQGRRHRRGAARIHRPSRHAAARGAELRAQRADRHQCPRPHQARRQRQDHHRLRHRPRHGARRRLVQFGARLHVRARLHPVAVLPHRPLPDRRLDAGPDRASARWWCPTRPSACTISTAPPSSRWPSWSRPRGSIIRRNSRRRIFRGASRTNEVKSFAELYPPLKPGELLAGSAATSDTRSPGRWRAPEEFRALPRAA